MSEGVAYPSLKRAIWEKEMDESKQISIYTASLTV